MNKSVIRIATQSVNLNYKKVWLPGTLINTTGSGVMININKQYYILTNYHCVENALSIEGVKYNADINYALKIVDRAPELDLALLSAEDPDFYTGLQAVDIVDPPAKGSTVSVIGFPQGGLNTSITKGIISRLTTCLYNGGITNLCIQIDAAVNRGNSGGPVIVNDISLTDNDKVIGIAFSHNTQMQNVCFVIPSLLINQFIRAFKSGGYKGVADLGVVSSYTSNPNLREYTGCTNGVIIDRINNSSVGHLLKIFDVILEINGTVINSDGTIYIEDYHFTNTPENAEKISYTQLIRSMLPGDVVDIKLMRNKQIKTVKLTLEKHKPYTLPLMTHDISTKYYIYAGLIMFPCNNIYVSRSDGSGYSYNKRNLVKYIKEPLKYDDSEVVVLHGILNTNYTTGYSCIPTRVLKVNDKEINNLKQLIKICERVSDQWNNETASTNDFVKFELEFGEVIIIRRVDPKISNEISLKYLRIPHTI